ncbi:MAG: hypothetical protein IJQ65_09535 [Kiritimatiellae bacterium]|nr:hypothetical protein [Kiritimatiellia bacterium]
MAKKVTIEVDAERSSLRIASGKMFLGTRTAVELDGWEPDSANHRPVLTVFAQGSTVPLAQSSYIDGALTLDLSGAELRKAFHGEAALHVFGLYLNQQVTENDGGTWTWKPDVEAVGAIFIDWSPEVFELDQAAFGMATLKGPPGQDGQDGKSAYQLAVENGYRGTIQEWLASMVVANALKGKTFEFSTATAEKLANGLKLIFEALGGTVL